MIVGWRGITPEEMADQQRLASLSAIPITSRMKDMRRSEPYGRLTALYPVDDGLQRVSKSTLWLCRCSCEKQKLVVVLAQNLGKPGKTLGCGCIHSDHARVNMLRVLQREDIVSRRRATAQKAAATRWANAAYASRVRSALRTRFEQARKKQGLSPEQPVSRWRIRLHNLLAPLRMYIFKRDGFKCLHCKTNRNLEVHHFIKIETDWTQATNPYNMGTFCEDCHFEILHQGNYRGEVSAEHTTKYRDEVVLLEKCFPIPADLVRVITEQVNQLMEKEHARRDNYARTA